MNSTNKFALELIRQNMAENGTVVVAEFQSEGKGQLGREWISNPYENLMFSIILKHVTNVPANPFIINKTITLSMLQCIREFLPSPQIRIKWPNDIYVEHRKICGILVENSFSGRQLNYSVAGIGLNVNQDFGNNGSLQATSIRSHTGLQADRPSLLKSILQRFEQNYFLMNKDSDTIETLFNRSLLGYMESCDFDIDNRREKARIVSCDPHGRLVLEVGDEQIPYMHGEIKQLIHA